MFDGVPPPELAAETIVVTARALPDPESERAYSVERIDSDRLRNSPQMQLDEVLKQVPGLQLFRRSDSRTGHLTSQGVTLRALGGNASSRALLILDGVPQADPFGGWINWPAYDPSALAEVRVIRGGGSVAHGPGALAGVIDMTSSLDRGFRAGLDIGSRQSLDGRVHLANTLGGGTLSFSAHGARGDGFVPITRDTRGPADQSAPYKEGSFRVHWLGSIAPEIELQLSASGFIDRRDRGLAFTGNRTDGADASVRLVGRGKWQWSALGYAQRREFESSFASVTPGRTDATRVSLQDSVPSHSIGGAFEIRPPIAEPLELRIGADVRGVDGETHELFAYSAGQPTRRRVAGGQALTAGAFADLTVKVGQVTLNGGTRLDLWRIASGELREWAIVTGEALRDERFSARTGWLPTARLGGVWTISQGWDLRASAYRGWRLPTLNELFRPFRAGQDATAANAELDPERVSGIEAGLSYRHGRISLSMTAFANRLNGAIANVTLGQGPGIFPGVGFVPAGGEFRQRRNLDAVIARGFEGVAEFRRGPWSARAGVSWVDATVHGNGEASQLNGLRPAQTPSLSLSGTIGWARDNRAMFLSVRHTGNQFEDDLNQRRLPPATTIDAFAAWPLGRCYQLVLRAENLLNERVVAGHGSDGAIERATPRTMWLGLKFWPSRR